MFTFCACATASPILSKYSVCWNKSNNRPECAVVFIEIGLQCYRIWRFFYFSSAVYRGTFAEFIQHIK